MDAVDITRHSWNKDQPATHYQAKLSVSDVPVRDIAPASAAADKTLTLLQGHQDRYIFLSGSTTPGQCLDIGSGGVGTCFSGMQVARDGSFQRYVCVKVSLQKDRAFKEWRAALVKAHKISLLHAPEYALALFFAGQTSYSVMGLAIGTMDNCKVLIKNPDLPDLLIVARFICAVGRTLAALHDEGIAHLDVKLANCLVSENGTINLADFDQARKYDDPLAWETGNASYDAPERQGLDLYESEDLWGPVETHCKDYRTSDIYAFGIAIAKLYGIHLGFGANIANIVASEKIRARGDRHDVTPSPAPRVTRFWKLFEERLSGAHQPIGEMIRFCLSLDMRNRPSAKSIVRYVEEKIPQVREASGPFVDASTVPSEYAGQLDAWVKRFACVRLLQELTTCPNTRLFALKGVRQTPTPVSNEESAMSCGLEPEDRHAKRQAFAGRQAPGFSTQVLGAPFGQRTAATQTDSTLDGEIVELRRQLADAQASSALYRQQNDQLQRTLDAMQPR